MSSTQLLVVDDDQRLRDLLTEYLTRQGFAVRVAADGEQGLTEVERAPPDLVILDVMMPGIDGLDVCRRIRAKSQVPIIMLTAKGEDTDRIVGVELGADDYLPKPFNPRELVARIHAVVRRAGELRPPPRWARAGDLELDAGARRAWLAGQELDLTSTEFDILMALVRAAGRVVSRDGLMEQARGQDSPCSTARSTCT